MPVLDKNVLPFGIAEVPQCLPECVLPRRISGRRHRGQIADARDFLRLLRIRSRDNSRYDQQESENRKP
jgi:hypothetical protein